jgi:hypothetical protein
VSGIADSRYASGVDAILSRRHDNGADLWPTPEKCFIKGAPFTTLECVMYLLEPGMEPSEREKQAYSGGRKPLDRGFKAAQTA